MNTNVSDKNKKEVSKTINELSSALENDFETIMKTDFS